MTLVRHVDGRAAQQRDSTGSAAVTKAAHISAAKTLVRSPGTSQDTSGGNDDP